MMEDMDIVSSVEGMKEDWVEFSRNERARFIWQSVNDLTALALPLLSLIAIRQSLVNETFTPLVFVIGLSVVWILSAIYADWFWDRIFPVEEDEE